MKAVDFIVELSESYMFIEVKDPDDPNSSEMGRQEFLENFRVGGLDEDLKQKYRDSFLYEWARGRADKPIYYFVLIAHGDLDGDILSLRTDELRRKLPVTVPSGLDWQRPIVKDAAVLDLAAWNRAFPQFPVERISESADAEDASAP